jgi:hypothetical protein
MPIENARLLAEPGVSAFRAVPAQIRTALNSVPLIETAASAERKALTNVRMSISPVRGRPLASGEQADGVAHKVTQLRNM